MRIAHLLGAAALTLTACGPAIDVRTVVSPDAGLSRLAAFRILPVPRPRDDTRLAADDPMLVNSITNRVLHNALVEGFQTRGYVLDETDPDFAVAYYASARRKLDITYWNYGYVWRPRWWRGWGPRWGGATMTEYTEGTVIVDVLDAKTRDLLWRGRGVAVVSDDIQKYLEDLKATVTAILDELPRAQATAARHPLDRAGQP